MMRVVAPALLALAAGGTTIRTPDHCEAPAADRASADLYCIALVPRPGFEQVSGHAVLDIAPGPFTISVTRDGRHRYRPVIVLDGLPAAGAILAEAKGYVAWAVTPQFSEMVRLGVVGNGRTAVGEVAHDQFVILVSAETDTTASEPGGRVVLRGGSPSTRLQPPDFQQFALAIMQGDRHGHHASPADGALEWRTVPMPPNIGMLPSEMALRPPVAPFLPEARLARRSTPSRVVRLASGDTLRLTAGMLRRRIHGRDHVMYAFNGQSPGPMLAVERGARVTVILRNELDQPTTVHWHGLRLDWRMDGVPHLSQEAVAPGAEFAYTLVFPDAGVFWYHPHVREDIQQDLGLAGNILVRGAPSPWREEFVMVDDLLVGDDGSLVPFGASATTHALMGRFGNVLLANGEPRLGLAARPGETVRYWFTNASNARTFNLSFPGATMRLVAADLGAFPSPVPVESVVLAPAERYAVDVTFPARPVALENRVRALDHVFGRFVQQVDTLATVAVRGRAVPPVPTQAAGLDAVAPATPDVPAPHVVLGFGVHLGSLPFVTSRMMLLDSAYFHPVEWSGTMVGMNWATTSQQARWFVRDMGTGRENDSIDLRVRQGDRRVIRLVNQRSSLHAMHHPIHLHGQRFLVLAVNGVAPPTRAWKDTILLPAGAVADILVEFDNPGHWMLHCHIAEHVESGMMTTFHVEPR